MDNAYNPITGEDPLPYSELAHLFLSIRSQIKLYHWQTRIYARHKATDRFLDTFEPLVDRFVEAAQGIAGMGEMSADRGRPLLDSGEERGIRIGPRDKTMVTAGRGPTDETASEYLSGFRDYIADENIRANISESELLQILDDILEICDVTLYLFTLK